MQSQREYDGDLRQLASMRAFLREVCGESLTADIRQRLELALTEAASNIILHGQQQTPITLTIDVVDDLVSMTLRYKGKPFDPQAAAPPVFDGSQEGGFGLYLIRQSVDEVHYSQEHDGQSALRLVIKRKREDHGTSS